MTDSIQTVKRNQQQYDLPLKILSYDELYGWTMDRIVEQVGRKNNCTFPLFATCRPLTIGDKMLQVPSVECFADKHWIEEQHN